MKTGLASRLLGLELHPPPSSRPAGASPEEDADVPAEPLELLVPLEPLVPLEALELAAEPEEEDADAPDA